MVLRRCWLNRAKMMLMEVGHYATCCFEGLEVLMHAVTAELS